MKTICKIAFIGLLMISCAGWAQNKRDLPLKEEAAPTVSSIKEYTQIDRAKLPQAIQDALAKDYSEMTVAQAFKTPADSYKIVLVAQDQRSTKTVYAQADGTWIEEDDG